MTGLKPQCSSRRESPRDLSELYPLYRQLHDAFGTKEWNGNLYGVMKELIEIRIESESETNGQIQRLAGVLGYLPDSLHAADAEPCGQCAVPFDRCS